MNDELANWHQNRKTHISDFLSWLRRSWAMLLRDLSCPLVSIHVRHIKTSSFHFGDQNEWGSRVLTSRRAKPASEELQWRRSSVGAQIRAVHHKDRSYNRDCTYKHHKFWWTLLLSLHSKLMVSPSVSLPIRKLNYRTTPYSFANHKTGDKVEYSLISAYVKHWAHSSLYELETVQSIRVHDDSRVINGDTLIILIFLRSRAADLKIIEFAGPLI